MHEASLAAYFFLAIAALSAIFVRRREDATDWDFRSWFRIGGFLVYALAFFIEIEVWIQAGGVLRDVAGRLLR